MGKREGIDAIWAEPDWDAPHNQRRETLPANARCETCRYWFGGACGLDTRRVVCAECRCVSFDAHPDYVAQVEAAAATWRPPTGGSKAKREALRE